MTSNLDKKKLRNNKISRNRHYSKKIYFISIHRRVLVILNTLKHDLIVYY